MDVKEFRVNLLSFPDGGGYYAVVDIDGKNPCSRCLYEPPATSQEKMRLVLFYDEVLEPDFAAEICCGPCGDQLRDAHAARRR